MFLPSTGFSVQPPVIQLITEAGKNHTSFSLLICYHTGELKQLVEGTNVLCSHNISTEELRRVRRMGQGRKQDCPFFGHSKLLIHVILSHEILAQEEPYDNKPNCSET